MPLLSLVPLRAWLLAGAVILAGLACWKIVHDAEQRGVTTIVTEIQKGQTDAQDRAEAERRRLDRGDDSRVRQFDRD